MDVIFGAIARFSLFERENAAPAVLHADDSPAGLGRFVVALLRILPQIEDFRDTRNDLPVWSGVQKSAT